MWGGRRALCSDRLQFGSQILTWRPSVRPQRQPRGRERREEGMEGIEGMEGMQRCDPR